MATPNAESTSDTDPSQKGAQPASGGDEGFFVEPELDENDRSEPAPGQQQFAQTYEEESQNKRGSEDAADAPQEQRGTRQEEDNPDLPPGSETNPFNATSEEAGEVNTETPNDGDETDGPSAEELDESEESHKDSDETDSESEADQEGPFFEGDESVYDTPEEAKRGIEEKDRYIDDLESRVEETEEQATEQVQELSSKLQEANQRLERYYEQLPEDRLEEMAIQEYMDEDYRGKSPDDFANDQELQEFYDARAEAKAEYRQELQRRENELEDQQRAQREAMESAKSFVEDNATPDFFGAKAPEQKAKLRQLEQAPEDGHSDLQKAQYVAAAFGEEAGRIFLEGLKTKFDFAGGASKPQEDPSPNVEDETKETPEKTVERTKVRHRPTHTPPANETPPMDDREEAKHAFKANVREGKVDV